MSFRQIVEAQRDYFLTGKPAKLSHRREQLLKLKTLLTEGKDVLSEAVHRDLRRLTGLTYVFELSGLLMEIDYVLENLEECSRYCTENVCHDVGHADGGEGTVGSGVGDGAVEFSPLYSPYAAHRRDGRRQLCDRQTVGGGFSHCRHYLAVVQGGVGETTELLKKRFDHTCSCSPVAMSSPALFSLRPQRPHAVHTGAGRKMVELFVA